MERLIELDTSNKLVIQPEALAIPAYAEIWTRDKTKDKKIAIQELGYVWYKASLDKHNPFRHFYGEERDRVIRESIMPKNWKPDVEILKAVNQFEKNNYTMATGFINAAMSACNKLKMYYETVDLNERTATGGLVHKASDLMKNIADVGKTLEGLRTLEKQQTNEEGEDDKIRGGGKIGAFEE